MKAKNYINDYKELYEIIPVYIYDMKFPMNFTVKFCFMPQVSFYLYDKKELIFNENMYLFNVCYEIKVFMIY